jgi:hypothetical protein
MTTLLIIGAIAIIAVGVPAFGYVIGLIIRRPLTPEQEKQDELVRERRRDARYFWR